MPKSKKEPLIEQMAEAPAVVLEKTGEAAEAIAKPAAASLQKAARAARAAGEDYWHMLGPGLTTGASDDDPSGIATYSQTGARYGTSLLWLAPLTFPLMAIIQEMCARIGLVSGRGLAGNIRERFPRPVLLITAALLFTANAFNIGADLGAMAKVTQLIWPAASFALLIIGWTLICLLLQIYASYAKYAAYLKWLAMILLAYVITAFLIPDFKWAEVMQAAVTPSINFSKDQLILICGILGTTISPYLFFWQTSQEVEEEILEGKKTISARQESTSHELITKMRIDVWSGMLFSNLVMFFIIAVSAFTLFKAGITNIGTAADAAEALRPLAGNGAYWLFALGVIGTGLLGVPVLAGSASYAVSESFGWRNGLYRQLKSATAFYGVIIISTLIGLGLNFMGIDPIKALIWSAVLNGLVAPVILIQIVMLASNKKVMGKYVNGVFATSFGWLVVALMAAAGAATIWALF